MVLITLRGHPEVGDERALRQLLTWLLTGLHWEGNELLKKARRKGLSECIHPPYGRDQRSATCKLSKASGGM